MSTFRRARDLVGTVFPVSELVILQTARKHGIGKKFGRVVIFSDEAVNQLYEALPCHSPSSADQRHPTGSSVAPSGESELRKALALATSGSQRKSGRNARPKSSPSPSTVVAWRRLRFTRFLWVGGCRGGGLATAQEGCVRLSLELPSTCPKPTGNGCIWFNAGAVSSCSTSLPSASGSSFACSIASKSHGWSMNRRKISNAMHWTRCSLSVARPHDVAVVPLPEQLDHLRRDARDGPAWAADLVRRLPLQPLARDQRR
jgi:hypothetical protein